MKNAKKNNDCKKVGKSRRETMLIAVRMVERGRKRKTNSERG